MKLSSDEIISLLEEIDWDAVNVDKNLQHIPNYVFIDFYETFCRGNDGLTELLAKFERRYLGQHGHLEDFCDEYSHIIWSQFGFKISEELSDYIDWEGLWNEVLSHRFYRYRNYYFDNK